MWHLRCRAEAAVDLIMHIRSVGHAVFSATMIGLGGWRLSSRQLIGMFLLLVWVPIVAAGSKDAFQWSETIVSWALLAAAWVVADSFVGTRWLAVGKR
jgi:hypothetical protein